MEKQMSRFWLVFCSCVGLSFSASAEEYFRQGWFEYPDPTTAPRTTTECISMKSADVPCPTWNEPGRWCRKETCGEWKTKTEILRVNPSFVISGPNSPDEAVKRAVQGIVAGCATVAISEANTAAAAVPADPASRIGAGVAAGVVGFKNCIVAVQVEAAVGGVLNQLEFRIDTPTHWAQM
jgi:hypothetical protein